MIVLADTQLILWSASEGAKLSAAARKLIDDPEVDLWFSAASIWEIAIKRRLDRPNFTVEPDRLRRMLAANGWTELAVSGSHASATAVLPRIHKDPFDRMLVAQAQFEGMALATSDRFLARYPGNIIRV